MICRFTGPHPGLLGSLRAETRWKLWMYRRFGPVLKPCERTQRVCFVHPSSCRPRLDILMKIVWISIQDLFIWDENERKLLILVYNIHLPNEDSRGRNHRDNDQRKI